MSEHVKKATALRNASAGCPNCAETIFLTYAEELGLTEEQALMLGTNFGGGMKCGGTCGVLTSGMAVLGALGITDPQSVGKFLNSIKENHSGLSNCVDLLRANAKKGGQKKQHCDGMIVEAVNLIDELAKNR